MMKFIGIALTAIMLTACLPKKEEIAIEPVVTEPVVAESIVAKPPYVLYDDRDSLAIAFNSNDLSTLLTEDEFAIYIQAIKFMGDEIGLGSSLSWSGPEETFGGRIEVKQLSDAEGVVCKAFTQSMTHSEIVYKGYAKICSKGDSWEVKEIK